MSCPSEYRFTYDDIVLPANGGYAQPMDGPGKTARFRLARCLMSASNGNIKRFYWSVYNTNKANKLRHDLKEHPVHGKGYFGITQECLWNVGIRWIGGDQSAYGNFKLNELVSYDLVAEKLRERLNAYILGQTGPIDARGVIFSLTGDAPAQRAAAPAPQVVTPVAARAPAPPVPVAVPVAASRAPEAEARLCDTWQYKALMKQQQQMMEAQQKAMEAQQKAMAAQFEQQMRVFNTALYSVKRMLPPTAGGLVRVTKKARVAPTQQEESSEEEEEEEEEESSEEEEDDDISEFSDIDFNNDDDVIRDAFRR